MIMQMMSKYLSLIIFASIALGDCHLMLINDVFNRKHHINMPICCIFTLVKVKSKQ